MSAQQATRQRPNGRAPSLNDPPVKVEVAPEQLQAALEHEAAIEVEAGAIWDLVSDAELTPKLFRKLWPLLRRPIHEGYISEVTQGKGKPYPSKGIKSVQVQIDRMDNVLGPLNWGWETRFLNDAGTLAEVAVWVLGSDGELLVERKARGGVDRGSTLGNTFKGTETNAAKLAFARLGPGHEVYIGLTDLDPDVNEDAAQAQAEGGSGPVADRSSTLVTAEQVANLKKAVEDANLTGDLAMKLRGFGVDAIEKLSLEQGMALWSWAQGGES